MSVLKQSKRVKHFSTYKFEREAVEFIVIIAPQILLIKKKKENITLNIIRNITLKRVIKFNAANIILHTHKAVELARRNFLPVNLLF